MKKQKVALVLSGGGARGLAHIGVIEELEKEGFEITSIAGTSMGSLIGGVYAKGQLEEFKEWICDLDRNKVLSLIDLTLNTTGLIKGEKVLNRMKEFITDQKIEKLNIPYTAIAANIMSGEEVILNKGSLYEAIRASIAIPSVFTPVKKGKDVLVDGGIVNNLPINRVKRTKGDIVVAVNVLAKTKKYTPRMSKKELDKREKRYDEELNIIQGRLQKFFPKKKEQKLSYFDIITKTINTMLYQNTQFAMKEQQPDILINISKDSCNIFDFHKADELIAIGKYQAKKN